ncbi:MAG: hypothetical protein RLZZ410_97 [Pseudomonadota bacterium]
MFNKKTINQALLAAWGLMPMSWAAAHGYVAEYANLKNLDPISVIASKGDRVVSETPHSVSLIDYEEIKRRNSRDVKELFNDELDVEVRAQSSKFGISSGTGRTGQESINVRGLEGNQVLLMVDGIPLPHAFNYSAASTGRVDYLEMEGIGQVEVLRGPASTLYGSDGLAAAINFQTISLENLIQPNSDSASYVKGVHRTINRSNTGALGFAKYGNDLDTLLISSTSSGAELKNKGGIGSVDESRTQSNPESHHQNYLLGKIKYHISGSQTALVTIEDLQKKRDTELYSGRTMLVADLDAKDHVKRQRASIDLESLATSFGFEDHSKIKLWVPQSSTQQLTIQDGAIARLRNNLIKDKSTGLQTQFVNYFDGLFSQKWTYGLDWQKSTISQDVKRSGDYNDQLKYFPETVKNQVGLFTQLELDNSNYSWIPAVRFDRYSFKSKQQGYSLPAVDLEDSAWSPSFAGIWKYHSGAHPYFSWSKGFRAPTQDQINNGFTNLRHGYTSQGNSDLKSETSQSFEWGLKGKSHALRYSFAAYTNRYKNFIEQQIISGSGRPSDPLIYQYVNHSQAKIHGLDVRGEAHLNSAWHMTGGWVTSRGYKETVVGARSALDTIQPMRVALGIAYKESQWDVTAHWIYTWAKKPNDVGTVTDMKSRRQVTQYVAPGYSLVNLQAQWRPIKDLSFNAGIHNLFNKKYWRWSDVRGLEASSAVIDAYTAPGRNLSLGMRYDF